MKRLTKKVLFLTLASGIFFISSCASPNRQISAQNGDEDRDNRPAFKPGASRIPKAKASGNNMGFAPAPPSAKLIAPKPKKYFYEKLEDLQLFDESASISEGLVKGSAMKFLVDNRTPTAKIYFINGNFTLPDGTRPEYVKFHFDFAKEALKIPYTQTFFDQNTYFNNPGKPKLFIAGTVQKYEMLHGAEVKTFFGIQFYPQDNISEDLILKTAKLVRENIKFKDHPFSIVSYGSQQTTNTIKQELAALEMESKTVDQVYAGIPYIPMNLGETYGYLRYLHGTGNSDELTEQDIPVFSELPLDLSVVAGVITTVVQDAGAHVNLKSKERNTPNMVIREASGLENIKALDGMPVHLVVTTEGYTLEKTSTEKVTSYFREKNKNKKWTAIQNGIRTELLTFDEMAAQHTPLALTKEASSYGGKAAKLGFLAHKKIVGMGSSTQQKIGYRLTPLGFSIPVHHYQEFLKHNPQLQAKLAQLSTAEMDLGTESNLALVTPLERAQKVKEIQAEFHKAKVPDVLFAAVTTKIADLKKEFKIFYPTAELKKIKVRSSANAEDIPNFDGAGLHDSFGAKIDKIGDPNEPCTVEVSSDGVATKQEMKPETVMCAIKGVFGSLWNKRAIEERNYARIDQRSVAMGIAINVAYDFRKNLGIKEVGNAVVVTRVINSDGVYGYRLSTNTDDNLVTNPTPNTQTEIIIASFITPSETPQLTFIQYAKTGANSPVMTKPLFDDKVYKVIVDVARQVETKYCFEIPGYYTGDCRWVPVDNTKPASLDMELKIYSNGEVILKQVREFSGK